MIPDFTELNFPHYATLSQANVSLPEMDLRTITTQVQIDGDITPDFSYDWEIMFKGERYIQPLRTPQALKDTSTQDSKIDLTFYHWVEYELRRNFFVSMAVVGTDRVIPDKYVTPLNLDIYDFVEAFQDVLDYYYKGGIKIVLNTEIAYSRDKANMSISYSYLWDVLQNVYKIYGVRWVIENDTIKLGFPAPEISHVFEYGYEKGLLSVERQVQNENIRNSLLGRGGTKNIPKYYFKNAPENSLYASDPDAIPELELAYFPELRSAEFRSYVQGWKTNPKRDTKDGTISVEQYDSARGEQDFAYRKGHEDASFDPVEYVKDDESIAKYGILPGGLENNEDIYPSIQNISIAPIGLVNEVVDVEKVVSDDVDKTIELDSIVSNMEDITVTKYVKHAETKQLIKKTSFIVEVEPNKGNASFIGVLSLRATKPSERYSDRNPDASGRDKSYGKEEAILDKDYKIISQQYYLVDSQGEKYSGTSLPAGKYMIVIECTIQASNVGGGFFPGVGGGDVSTNWTLCAELSLSQITLIQAGELEEPWKPTFDVWVKNIWQTEKQDSETDGEYTDRVWLPILGTEGREAMVTFTSGWLASSTDWEFKVIKYTYDTSKTYNGVPSHWKLTLQKSDAELEATDKYIPNVGMQAVAGDTFFFTNIDMPHLYVLWGEQRVREWKYDSLQKTKDINPSWIAKFDKIRINSVENEETEPLINSLLPGARIRLADKRFSDTIIERYIQSVSYTYSDKLLPEIEAVLSDNIEPTVNPVQQLQANVELLSAKIAHIDTHIVNQLRQVFDAIYLRKDGIEDLSNSPTAFKSIVKSDDFRQGIIGGAGWGIYRDTQGKTIAEVDQVKARQSIETNSFVKNETKHVGGKLLYSAASIEVSSVEETDSGYICYYNTKGGTLFNMFAVDDVAYCQRNAPDNELIKSYKAKVVEVGVDYITLSKTVFSGDIPTKDDVVIHYGNYTNTDRQYVIIRDVIGGGYDRMLAGLDSISATGKEYYFAGRQNNETPRWFVGNADSEYAEWKDGKMRVKGKLEVGSDVGGATVVDGGLVTAETISLGGTEIKAGSTGTGNTESSVRFWAGTSFKDRENAPFRVLQDGSVISTKGVFEYADIEKSTLTDVEIDGAQRTPFRNGKFILNDNSTTVSIPGIQNNNNVLIDAHREWETPDSPTAEKIFKIPFDIKYNGFRATIINDSETVEDRDNNKYAIISQALSDEALNTKRQGFFENGVRAAQIRLRPREGVELLGYGYGEQFFGWIVLNRFWIRARNVGYPLNVMYSGVVDVANKKITTLRSYNNKDLTCTVDTANYDTKISFPSLLEEQYMVMVTPTGSVQSISVYSQNSESFWVARRSYKGDVISSGGFNFMVINIDERYDPHKEYNKNWS